MRIAAAINFINVSMASVGTDSQSRCTGISAGYYTAMIGSSKLVSVQIDEGKSEFIMDVIDLTPERMNEGSSSFKWNFKQPIGFKVTPDCNIIIANENFATYAAAMEELSNIGGVEVEFTKVSPDSDADSSHAKYSPDDLVISFGGLSLAVDDDTTVAKGTSATAQTQVNTGHYMKELIGGIAAVVRIIDQSRMALTVVVPSEIPAGPSRVVRTLVDYTVSGDKLTVSANDSTVYMHLAFIEMFLQTLGGLDLSPEFTLTYCDECKLLKVGTVSLKLDQAVIKVDREEKEAKTANCEPTYH
jgi:hypothetical protein